LYCTNELRIEVGGFPEKAKPSVRTVRKAAGLARDGRAAEGLKALGMLGFLFTFPGPVGSVVPREGLKI
jgi:hypothetical protein